MSCCWVLLSVCSLRIKIVPTYRHGQSVKISSQRIGIQMFGLPQTAQTSPTLYESKTIGCHDCQNTRMPWVSQLCANTYRAVAVGSCYMARICCISRGDRLDRLGNHWDASKHTNMQVKYQSSRVSPGVSAKRLNVSIVLKISGRPCRCRLTMLCDCCMIFSSHYKLQPCLFHMFV